MASLKELSLESFAIIIGSLLNLNSAPSLFLEECIFRNVQTRDRGKPTFETANYNQGQVLNDLEVQHWAPVVAILKLHASFGWVGWAWGILGRLSILEELRIFEILQICRLKVKIKICAINRYLQGLDGLVGW